jgi:hypothetical protein
MLYISYVTGGQPVNCLSTFSRAFPCSHFWRSACGSCKKRKCTGAAARGRAGTLPLFAPGGAAVGSVGGIKENGKALRHSAGRFNALVSLPPARKEDGERGHPHWRQLKVRACHPSTNVILSRQRKIRCAKPQRVRFQRGRNRIAFAHRCARAGSFACARG